MQERSETLTLIAVYHFICGLGSLLFVCLFLFLPLIVGLSVAGSSSRDDATAMAVVAVIGLVGGGIFFLLAAANFAAGWGLWQRREWGRLTAIVLSVIRLINFPVGTIIGGLIIWFLVQPQARAEFPVRHTLAAGL
jgi:thiol:disulfide interchange protein